MSWRVDVGDCVALMAAMPACTVDAVVCDPPYGLEFMGKEWDRLDSRAYLRTRTDGRTNPAEGKSIVTVPEAYVAGPRMQEWHHRWATEALRVLKPGGHLLAFGGTRTSHRLACAIEDAGFEIRDTICWLYGSGFPKSLDVGKAIDKRAGENLETKRRIAAVAAVIREYRQRAGLERSQVSEAIVGTPSGACWNWEHHQLPSVEMWPAIKATLSIPDDYDALIDGNRAQWIAAERAIIGETTKARSEAGRSALPTLGAPVRYETWDDTAPATPDAERWDGWGTALKPAHEPIVVARKPLAGTVAANVLEHGTGGLNVDGCRVGTEEDTSRKRALVGDTAAPFGRGAEMGGNGSPLGRWPANVVLDEQAAAMLDQQSGEAAAKSERHAVKGGSPIHGGGMDVTAVGRWPADSGGGASRFFYTAKASRAERNAGLDGFEEKTDVGVRYTTMAGDGRADPAVKPVSRANHHPTVKPVSLMRWLCRLVTPPDGLILDPFTGSGTTGIAAVLEGFNFAGCEQDEAYADIARARIGWWELHGHDALRIVAEQEAAENEREAVRKSGQMELL